LAAPLAVPALSPARRADNIKSAGPGVGPPPGGSPVMTDRWRCAVRLLLPIAHVHSQICFADDSALETCLGLKLEDPPPGGLRACCLAQSTSGPRRVRLWCRLTPLNRLRLLCCLAAPLAVPALSPAYRVYNMKSAGPCVGPPPGGLPVMTGRWRCAVRLLLQVAHVLSQNVLPMTWPWKLAEA
jgi:hypothetical protein